VRAGASFHRRHPRRVDQAGATQTLGVFLSDKVVGHYCKIDAATL
jgi:hypothetical protein